MDQRWEDIKSEVLERFDVKAFAEAHLDHVQHEHDELKALCLFHDEKQPSMYVNKERRVWYCQGCGEKGNAIDLYMKVHNLPFKDALLQMAEELGVDPASPAPAGHKKGGRPAGSKNANPPISLNKVKAWHKDLRSRPERVKWLIKHRGMKRKTLARYLIGWDGQRYTIPVFDADGRVVNVRRYDPDTPTRKIIHYTEKRGDKTLKYGKPARLYGIDELAHADAKTLVHVTEGEWDRLMLAQAGWLAVTGTHGAKTWLEEWNKAFKGRDVVLLYDTDRSGRLAAAKVAKALHRVARKVRNVELPLNQNGQKDVTDWFVKAKQSAEALEKIIQATPPDGRPEPDGDEGDLDFIVNKLTTYDSVPKKYVLDITPTSRNRGEMEINGDTLLNPAKFERAYTAYFNRCPEGMPPTARGWKRIVNGWLDRSEVIEQPPEASELAALREVLIDELRKMPISEGRSELDRAKALVTPSGERIFKAVALRRILVADFGDVTKHTMCAALRRIGCESKVVKVDKHPVKVWTIPKKLWEDEDGQGQLLN